MKKRDLLRSSRSVDDGVDFADRHALFANGFTEFPSPPIALQATVIVEFSMGNLIYAGRALVFDMLPTIAFAVLMALHVDIRIVTAVAIAISVGMIAVLGLVLRRPIAPLQWASLGLVLVFGTAGIMTNDPRYLMAKPTLVYAIVGVVMLKRGWMLRYLPPVAEGRGAGTMIAFGYVWAGLMFATAGANLVTAIWLPAIWPAFLAIVPTTSKIGLFAIQYLTVRAVVMRQVRAEAALRATA